MVDDTQTPPKKSAKKVVKKKATKKKATKKKATKKKATKKKIAGPPMLELIIGDETGKHDNADVPVRWCMNQALLKDIEKKGVLNPHVLLVTLGENGKEMPGGRTMAPLKELMSIGRFTRPGNNTIHGLIVHHGTGDYKKLRRWFLDKTLNGRYQTDLVHDGKLDPNTNVKEMTLATAKREVSIPDGVFAKKLPDWLQWYVNLWHRVPLEDDCHQRRRMIVGIPKSIAVLGFVGYRFLGRLALASLIAGMGWFKSVRWKPVIQPFNAAWDDVLIRDGDGLRHNFFASLFKLEGYDSGDGWREPTGSTLIMLPFAPLWITIMVGLFWLLEFSFLAGIVAALLVLAFAAAMIGIGYGIHWMVKNVEWARRFGEPIFGFIEEGFMWCVDRLEEYHEWLLQREIERNRLDNLPELICPKNAAQEIVADFSQIEMRSWRLWFLRAKNKVCRPAAR